jgi:tRNA-specific 2-thiouridylase
MGFGRRIFVLGKNPASNAVTLGGEEGLYSDMLYASQVNLITVEKLNGPVRLAAMTRYRQKPFPVTVSAAGSDIIKVEFDSPQRAVAAGQAVVFYDGGAVFGGGTIAEVRKK